MHTHNGCAFLCLLCRPGLPVGPRGPAQHLAAAAPRRAGCRRSVLHPAPVGFLPRALAAGAGFPDLRPHQRTHLLDLPLAGCLADRAGIHLHPPHRGHLLQPPVSPRLPGRCVSCTPELPVKATRLALPGSADLWCSGSARRNPGFPVAQRSAAQHSAAQHSAAQRSTAQHSAAQRSTAQHSAPHHSTKHHTTPQHQVACRHFLHPPPPPPTPPPTHPTPLLPPPALPPPPPQTPLSACAMCSPRKWLPLSISSSSVSLGGSVEGRLGGSLEGIGGRFGVGGGGGEGPAAAHGSSAAAGKTRCCAGGAFCSLCGALCICAVAHASLHCAWRRLPSCCRAHIPGDLHVAHAVPQRPQRLSSAAAACRRSWLCARATSASVTRVHLAQLV